MTLLIVIRNLQLSATDVLIRQLINKDNPLSLIALVRHHLQKSQGWHKPLPKQETIN